MSTLRARKAAVALAGLAASTALVLAPASGASAVTIERGERAVNDSPQLAQAGAYGDPAAAGRTLDLINAERARNGVAPVRATAALNSIATNWAFSMGNRNTLEHNPNLTNEIGGYHWHGENVGSGADADQIHGEFLRSSGHRANLLDPKWTEVGIGAVQANGRLWIVEDFKQPL
jgi:uncharacterized protein YkwD